MSVISHLSDEEASECPECHTPDCLVKKDESAKRKVGQGTEEFIQDAAQELDQQKQELEKKR